MGRSRAYDNVPRSVGTRFRGKREILSAPFDGGAGNFSPGRGAGGGTATTPPSFILFDCRLVCVLLVVGRLLRVRGLVYLLVVVHGLVCVLLVLVCILLVVRGLVHLIVAVTGLIPVLIVVRLLFRVRGLIRVLLVVCLLVHIRRLVHLLLV